MYAPELRGAHVICARIFIVTVEVTTADTLTTIAVVLDCARVTIVTTRIVVGEDATQVGVTGIVGADIVIDARNRRPTVASTVAAGVAFGAGILVITLCRVVEVDAPFHCITQVVGTGVVVVAIELRCAAALGIGANIIQRADILIITWGRVGRVVAATINVALVVSAGILVVALEACAHAFAVLTFVVAGAAVAIVAQQTVIQR